MIGSRIFRIRQISTWLYTIHFWQFTIHVWHVSIDKPIDDNLFVRFIIPNNIHIDLTFQTANLNMNWGKKKNQNQNHIRHVWSTKLWNRKLINSFGCSVNRFEFPKVIDQKHNHKFYMYLTKFNSHTTQLLFWSVADKWRIFGKVDKIKLSLEFNFPMKLLRISVDVSGLQSLLRLIFYSIHRMNGFVTSHRTFPMAKNKRVITGQLAIEFYSLQLSRKSIFKLR